MPLGNICFRCIQNRVKYRAYLSAVDKKSHVGRQLLLKVEQWVFLIGFILGKQTRKKKQPKNWVLFCFYFSFFFLSSYIHFSFFIHLCTLSPTWNHAHPFPSVSPILYDKCSAPHGYTHKGRTDGWISDVFPESQGQDFHF